MWKAVKEFPPLGSAMVVLGVVGIFGVIGVLMYAMAHYEPSKRTAKDSNTEIAQPQEQLEEASTVKLPKVETKSINESTSVPFEKVTVEDPNLEKGKTELRTKGVNGVRTTVYELTLTDGLETSRRLVNESVTTAPVKEVTTVGTKVKAAARSSCDPNYSGCVPIASDVDCAGGSGNGPAYARGPLEVIGYDIYGLDRDGDGYACE